MSEFTVLTCHTLQKFCQGENFATFLNSEIFPVKFSPPEIPPPLYSKLFGEVGAKTRTGGEWSKKKCPRARHSTAPPTLLPQQMLLAAFMMGGYLCMK